MTTVADGLFQYGGVPVGSIYPILMAGGNSFWVDSENGLDGNSGSGPHDALKTLNAAYKKTVTNNNDVIILIPRATDYVVSAADGLLTWNKSYTHLIGLWAPNSTGQRVRVTMADAISTSGISLSGNGCIFNGIKFDQGSNVAASTCFTITGSRDVFINCCIAAMSGAVSAASATASTIKFTGGEEHQFINCTIGRDSVSRTNANADLIFTGGVRDVTFEKCKFIMLSGSNGEFWLDLSAASCVDGSTVFRDCIFLNDTKSGGTALTLGFNVNGAGIGGLVIMKNCMYFGASALCANTAASVIVDSAIAATLSGRGIAAHTS